MRWVSSLAKKSKNPATREGRASEWFDENWARRVPGLHGLRGSKTFRHSRAGQPIAAFALVSFALLEEGDSPAKLQSTRLESRSHL